MAVTTALIEVFNLDFCEATTKFLLSLVMTRFFCDLMLGIPTPPNLMCHQIIAKLHLKCNKNPNIYHTKYKGDNNMKKNVTLRTDFCDELVVKEHQDDALSYVVKEINGCQMTHIKIEKEVNILKKEIGDYITIDFENIHDAINRNKIIECIDQVLVLLEKEFEKEIHKILVVGLGNRDVVSDALGPQSSDQILVTSHLYEAQRTELLKGTRNVATLSPGVMGQTGIESAKIVESIAKLFEADLVIVIDALATSSLKRINSAIQINNVGIKPGSGVGNHRMELSEKSLGCPIIAIGIATVTSIGAMLKEATDKIEREDILELMQEEVDFDLVVTPKNMDDVLHYMCLVLSESLNRFIHPNYEQL